MSRVHDMGGRFGDGPVVPDAPDAPVFATDWHARALAITVASGGLGKWNIDMSRHARECLAPADYMRFGYYEKWIAALADMLVAQGLVSRAELAGGAPQGPATAGPVTVAMVRRALAQGAPADRPATQAPAFAPGDAVRSLRPPGNRAVPGGHTRLPGYAAGARGRVLRLHGHHVLPDASAHGTERAEPLYAVAFPAAELWTAPEHPRDEVVIDMWQSYLEPAA